MRFFQTTSSAKELGRIAACITERSGQTVENPYPEQTVSWLRFEDGYKEELKKLQEESRR